MKQNIEAFTIGFVLTLGLAAVVYTVHLSFEQFLATGVMP